MKAVAVPVGGLLVQLRLLQSLESKEEERRGYQLRMLDAIKKLQAYERRQAPALFIASEPGQEVVVQALERAGHGGLFRGIDPS